MPPLEERDLHQPAVLWPVAGRDRYNEPTRGTPEQIYIRLERRRRQMLNPDGQPITVDAVAYAVQREGGEEVTVRSHIAEGLIADWDDVGTADVSYLGDVYEVVAIEYTPDIRNRAAERALGLRRWKYSLPST